MRTYLLGLSALFLACTPAAATDVEFSGTVSNTCGLTVSTAGTLGLAADGKTLGSAVGTGNAAVVGIVSIGVNTITVDAPLLTESPVTYDPGPQTLEVSYSGPASQVYTAAQTNFEIGITTEDLTIENRVRNTLGFDQGAYKTKTVVTCQ